MFKKSIVAPVILIVIGCLFLLRNLGVLPNLGQFIHQWWPLVLIAVGGLMLLRRVP